jgi:hypothetical protein
MICIHREVPQLPLKLGVAQGQLLAANVRRPAHSQSNDELAKLASMETARIDLYKYRKVINREKFHEPRAFCRIKTTR